MTTERFHWPPPPSTPAEAPWREIEALINGMGLVTAKIDELLAALLAIVPGVPGVPGAPGVPGIPGAPVAVVIQLTTGPATEIFRRGFTELANPNDSEVIDFTKGLTLLIKAESTLDQAVTLQPVGNIINSIDKSTNIGLPLPLPAQANTTIIISQAVWHPYVWVRVTPLVAPAQGNLVISYAIHG